MLIEECSDATGDAYYYMSARSSNKVQNQILIVIHDNEAGGNAVF